MVYLITWCCYGGRVPGDDGVVSRHNHQVGARLEPANVPLARAARSAMINGSYTLGPNQRQTVLAAVYNVCAYRRWNLLAAHVRTTHVHVVAGAETTPERILNTFKCYSTRALNRKHRTWERHGSTLYLWTPEEISNAVRYVVSKQGEPMAVYEG